MTEQRRTKSPGPRQNSKENNIRKWQTPGCYHVTTASAAEFCSRTLRGVWRNPAAGHTRPERKREWPGARWKRRCCSGSETSATAVKVSTVQIQLEQSFSTIITDSLTVKYLVHQPDHPSIHPPDHPSTWPSIQRLICPHYPGSRWAKRSNSIIAAHTQDSVCPGKMSQRSQENWLGYFLTIISTGLQCGAPLSPTGILELIFWLSAGMDKGKSGVRIRLSLCRSASEKPQLTTLWRMVRNAAAPLQETPLTTSCFPAVSLPNNLYIFHVE